MEHNRWPMSGEEVRVERRDGETAGSRQRGARALRSRSAPRSRRWALLEIPLLIAFSLGIALAVKGNVAQAFFISSGSMEPQLEVGDRVVVSRTSYRLHDVNRGDIVVFRLPSARPSDDPLPERIVKDVLETVALREPGDDELIKRVVGLPGETISAQARDGRRGPRVRCPASQITWDLPPLRYNFTRAASLVRRMGT